MRKILFITFITSFISLESQAESRVCSLWGYEVEEMSEQMTLNHCEVGDIINMWVRKDQMSNIDFYLLGMIRICEEGTIQVLGNPSQTKYQDTFAICKIAPLKKWKYERRVER